MLILSCAFRLRIFYFDKSLRVSSFLTPQTTFYLSIIKRKFPQFQKC